MSDNREPSEGQNPPVKLDQVRNMPGGALLRTIPGSQGRFMMATPVQSSAALISTTTTIQTQVLPKVTGQGVTPAGVSRINTVPIQTPSTTGYHVPRGAAAVANISVPRSSVATPIVRGPATLQTIGVSQQHTLPVSGGNSGRPVVGVACLSGQQRPPPIPVGARLVSSQMRPIGEASRPVLLHAATHKQVTLTQQQVQSTLQMSGAPVKSYSNATRHPSAPSLSRITATLPPGMVGLPTAVFLPSQPIKPQPQPKVITQSHGTSVQIPSATSSVPQTLSISTVVSRPVLLGSGTVGNSVRPAVKPTASTPTEPNPQLYIPGGGRSTILVRETPRTKEPEPISISVSSTHTTNTTAAPGVNTIYTLPGAAASYFEGGAVRPIVTIASRAPQGILTTTTSQPMRLNPLMVLDQHSQPPRIHSVIPTTSSSESSHLTIPMSENNIAGVPLTLTKQITSPRPSILRKRDPEGSPLKGAKNLTPLLTGMGRGGSPPPGLPPSPPGGKRGAESSSGGSTTVSANSSPGESPPAQPLPSTKEEEEPSQPPPPPVPQLRVLPPEVSPRKKPRKQQLTGNQMSEPTFSEDEMEFISEEKIKKEMKEEEIETKVIPKRKSMSLLSTYKNLWKARNNHFLRYTDVKAKEEKVPSLSDLANQKHALQKINGWKIYHLGSQIEDVVNSEDEFIEFYNSLLCVLEINQKKNKNKDIDKEYSRINERVRANFQRTKVAKDQMLDAKSQIMKFVEHKSYVADLISKSISKRSTNKKRERL